MDTKNELILVAKSLPIYITLETEKGETRKYILKVTKDEKLLLNKAE